MATAASALINSSTPVCSSAILATANPNRDGTGANAQVFAFPSPGSVGGRCDWIRIQALAATTAGMIRLFVMNPAGAFFMIAEIPVAAVTPSASAPAFSADYFPPYNSAINQSQLIAGPNFRLYASTENAEPFAVTAFGANM